jgi:hypothetical protein
MTPLTTGQILDRSFALYRAHFKLLAGLAVFPAVVGLLFGLGQVAYLLATHTPLNWTTAEPFTASYMMNMGIVLVGALARTCVYGISIAASTWCIARLYLSEPATMRAGFDYALRKWFRYLMVVVAQFWFAFWLPTCILFVAVVAAGVLGSTRAIPNIAVGFLVILLVLGYFAWLMWNFIRVSLAIPVCVIEGKTISASIRRSRALLVTRKVRIFLFFLFLLALESVFLAILIPLSVMIPRMGPGGQMMAQVATLVITFFYGVLVSPIAAVGLCLFYFDERVRREGFDIEYLMSRATPPPPAPTPGEVPTQ